MNNEKHIIEVMMKDGKFKNIDELMNAELNFDDKQLIDRKRRNLFNFMNDYRRTSSTFHH